MDKTRAPDTDNAQEPLTAFCASCPEPKEVEQVLEPFGLRQVFSLPADTTVSQAGLPPLPAQYHYKDESGTSVQYLAGVDSPCLADDDDEPIASSRYHYPKHASRFWLTPGGNELTARRVQDTLTSAFGLAWLNQSAGKPLHDAA